MFIAIIIILVVFAIAFGFSKTYMNKIKSNPEYENMQKQIAEYTLESELKNGKSITESFINSHHNDFEDIKQKMNGNPIDAFISCQYIESLSNRAKSETKNLLIGALTNTRYEKAQTTEVMVLSGKSLHLFIYAHEQGGVKLKGPKEQHIIYTEENLSDAILSDKKLNLTQSMIAKQADSLKEGPNKILTLTGHDGQLLSFLLYYRTIFGVTPPTMKEVKDSTNNLQLMVEMAKNAVDQEIISAYFIEQLESRFLGITKNIIE